MSYLDRLKQLDSGEIFHHTPKPEPTKPTEPPFDGFVGSIPGANENIRSENDTDEIGNGDDLIFQKVTRPIPTKPTEAPFDGFVGSTPGGVAILAPLPVLSPSGLWYFIPPAPLSPPMSAPGDIGLMDGLEVEF